MLDYLTTDRLPDVSSSATSSTTRRGGWTCGRCDNCGGLDLPTDVSPKAVAEAADRLARPGVPIEPRKHVADRARRPRARPLGPHQAAGAPRVARSPG